MKVYTLKELESSSAVVSINSLEEADQLTALCKERDPHEVTMSEWVAKRDPRKEYLSRLISKDCFIRVAPNFRWSFKESQFMDNKAIIITVNQIKEYVDKYCSQASSSKVVDIERLKNTESFTLVHCKTKEELEFIISAIGYITMPPDWNVYTTKTVLRIPAKLNIWRFADIDYYEHKFPNHSILSFDDICKKESKTKKQNQNLNQQKEVKQMKKYLRVFSKGQLNVEGLFYQIAKEGKVEEPRAFVRELIGKEVERVREETDKLDLKKLKTKFVKRYNIQAVGALETMEEIRAKGHFTSSMEDVLLVLAYYEFQKQKDNKVIYDWIKPYLTQKVLSNPRETVLFESKHRKVFIKAGAIKIKETKRAMISNVDIKYDKETNTFSL